MYLTKRNDFIVDEIETFYGHNNCHIINGNYISNIFDSSEIYLPNVVELVIYKHSMQDFYFMLRSLPKISKITFCKYENKLLKSFDFIKKNNIKNVVYVNCLNISELDLIKNYFETNNYTLQILNDN